MSNPAATDTNLGCYRILDLTEGGCMIGPRILGDLGADVIKIEPPGGSRSRIGPYYEDMPHPEKSLFWFAYNLNKRGITLNLNEAGGQELFKRLVSTADVVIESFEPGYLGELGLDYARLCQIKPDIIMTSITTFGQNGPKAHYKGGDLIAWASGGYLYSCGDPDRAPTWISFPQAELHAGTEAASGTMAALWHRRRSGEGQQVDVSMQECIIACDFFIPEMWDLNQDEFVRFAGGIVGDKKSGVRTNYLYQCKDGYIIFMGGSAGATKSANPGSRPNQVSMRNLVEWMDQEGMAPDWLKQAFFETNDKPREQAQGDIGRVEAVLGKFFKTKTKAELYTEGALKRRLMLGTVDNAQDISENVQLKSRHFWVPVEHPELATTLFYPGPFLKLSDNQINYRRRAPLIGEHNVEVYHNEMGISPAELVLLKQAMVI